MRFSQYMSAGQGGEAAGGTISDLGLVCFEDGTCMPGSGFAVGTAHDPNGFRTGRNSHQTYGDGTGGHFLYTRNTVTPNRNYAAYQSDQTGGPQPSGPPTASPRVGMAFAQLLDLMRRERGVRRPPEQRNRGNR